MPIFVGGKLADEIDSVANVSTTATVQGGTLTDGTASITSGNLTSTGFPTWDGASSEANGARIGDASNEMTFWGGNSPIGFNQCQIKSTAGIVFLPTSNGVLVAEDGGTTNWMKFQAHATNGGSFISNVGSGKFSFFDDASTANSVSIVSGGVSTPEIIFDGSAKISSTGGQISFDNDTVITTGNVQGGTLTDGTASINAGALTGVVSEVLTPGAAPGSPVEGMIYYDSTANKLKVYTGAAWETVTSA